MAKLIIVEGIPGSGKTTFSSKIEEFYLACNKNVQLYREGDLHPADLAWHAILEKDEFEDILIQQPNLHDVIKKHSVVEDEEVVVAYTKLALKPEDKTTQDFLEKKEVYGGYVDYERFTEAHLKRWHRFLKSDFDEDDVIIFECSYLQNHVTELVLSYDKPKHEIIEHLYNLVDVETNLEIKLIYLDSINIEETIDRVAKERVSNDKTRWSDWIDLVIQYIETSHYGKLYGLKGYDGVIKFMKLRKGIEAELMSDLPFEVDKIDNKDFNWTTVWEDIKKCL